MIDKFHEYKLPVCSLCMSHILEWAAEFLNGYVQTCDTIIGSTADTEINPDINFNRNWFNL